MMEKRASKTFERAIFVFGALCVLFGMTMQAQAATNSYKSLEYGFSFDFPAEWTLGEPNKEGGPSVFVYAKPEANFATNFNVVVSATMGVDKINKEQLTEVYRNTMGDVKMLSFKKGSFKGSPSLLIEHLWAQGDHKIQQRQLLVDHKGKSYSLTFTAQESHFKKHEKDFDLILNSFNF